MQTRRLGRSGLEVSTLALGSWLTFGESVDRRVTIDLTHRAYDAGIQFFDTADVYANGAAEEALGAAIDELPRHHLVIATKCFFASSERPNNRGLSRKHVFESVEGSLRRLGTDYIDLHQCHRFDPDTPLEETVRAYEDLIRHGKLLYWGVSQWTGPQIAEACRIADETGGFRPISNQPPYSILERGIESEVLPTCEREGVGQVVFSPLAQGALSGKYAGGARPAQSRAADPRFSRWMEPYLDAAVLERVEALRPIAADRGLTMAQLALAWCLRRSGVASVITGVTRAEQLEENCKASEAPLDDEVMARIDALFPAKAAGAQGAPRAS